MNQEFMNYFQFGMDILFIIWFLLHGKTFDVAEKWMNLNSRSITNLYDYCKISLDEHIKIKERELKKSNEQSVREAAQKLADQLSKV